MTGDEQDPYNDWICLRINGQDYLIAQRGSLVFCLWVAGIAVAGWLLTQYLNA